MHNKHDKNSFLIPAVIFAVAVSIVGGFLAVQGANQLTSSGLTATSAAIGTGAPLGGDGALSTTGGVLLNTAGAADGLLVPNGNVGIGDATPASLFTVGNGDLFQVTSSGYVRGPNGSVSNPTFSFVGDTNTGIYTTAANANTIAFSTNGVEKARISNNGRFAVYDTLNTLAAVDTNGAWTWTNVVTYSSGIIAGPIDSWQGVMLSSSQPVLGIRLSGSSDDGGECAAGVSNYFYGAVTNNGYITDFDLSGNNSGMFSTSGSGAMATRTFLFDELSAGRDLGSQAYADNSAYNKALGLSYIPPGKALWYEAYAADGASNEYVNCTIDVLYGTSY